MIQSSDVAEPRRRRWPVPRSLLIGVAPAVLFFVITAIRAKPSDDYTSVGQTLDSVVRAILLPELITGGILAIIVTALGWWPIVWLDRTRGGPRWTFLAPALVLFIALGRLPIIGWAAQSVQYFLLLAAATLLVGFFEETMARGMLIAGLRRRLPEIWVWALSSAIFGLLHFVNALAGQPLSATVVQVIFAASFGSTLYVARRMSKSLLLPIVLHAAWDFGSIGVLATGIERDPVRLGVLGLLGLLSFGVLAFGVVAGVFAALWDDRGLRLQRRWRGVPPIWALAVPAPTAEARFTPTAHSLPSGS